MKLSRVFEPITINGMTLKNRILMPAFHHTYTPDGFANDRFKEYYWRRAEGGTGLIVVGGCRIDDYGGTTSMISLQRDEFIPGYKEFTDGMHARGAKVGVQLYQAGRYTSRNTIPDHKEALAPSAVFSRYTKETPKEMTIKELKGVVKSFADGARRAQKAGFDMVEIVGSAGYLICQFLSPVTNLRTDEYGGSWENRTRFPREVVAAVRQAVGKSYPLGMRIAGNDFMEGSNTNAEAVVFAKLMEAAGIDVLNVTGGWHESVVPQITGDLPRGGYTYLAGAIRDAVKIPVAVSNRINNPELAEKILAIGEADMISIGRPHLADPDWVKKAQEGRSNEIRKCVACNQGCLAKTFFSAPVECLVNGSCGREYLLKEKKATSPSPKNILVVGAGPAGCEFAIAATERGHKVTIWEKSQRIGGQLSQVSVPPGKKEFNTLTEYFDTMLKKYNVSVAFGKRADAESIKNAGYDAVVVATGMIPNQIRLQNNGNLPVYSAYEVLRGEVMPGKDIVIIGGGSVGCETAQHLAHEAALSPEQIYFLMEHHAETLDKISSLLNLCRRNIAVVDIAKVGAGFDPGTGWPVLKDLRRLGVKLYPLTKVTGIEAGGVTLEVTDKKTAEVSTVVVPCDTIITAVGASSNNELYNQLKDSGVTAYNVGDSNKVAKVIDAIRASDELAYEI